MISCGLPADVSADFRGSKYPPGRAGGFTIAAPSKGHAIGKSKSKPETVANNKLPELWESPRQSRGGALRKLIGGGEVASAMQLSPSPATKLFAIPRRRYLQSLVEVLTQRGFGAEAGLLSDLIYLFAGCFQ